MSHVESGPLRSTPGLQMEVECDLTQVRTAASEVRKFLKRHGCSERACIDCELVVVEGCNNAIKHARPRAPSKPMEVEVLLESGQIELRITDHGPGFVWPETVQLPDPEHESGRGLYLIRSLMNEAAYVCRPSGNILVLKKSR